MATTGVTVADRQQRPGMLPEEILIFNAWWAVHQGEYSAAYFNVRVGKGNDPGPAWPDWQRRNAILNSQRRIDALLYRSNTPIIAEVKRRARIDVIGQILSYQDLWNRDNPSAPYPEALLICNVIDDDLVYVLNRRGVAFVTVQVDLSSIPSPR